jgi:hypothetical protein
MRVKIRRDAEDPSTQIRTKARHDPATLRVVQETLGEIILSAQCKAKKGCSPPLMLRKVKR